MTMEHRESQSVSSKLLPKIDHGDPKSMCVTRLTCLNVSFSASLSFLLPCSATPGMVQPHDEAQLAADLRDKAHLFLRCELVQRLHRNLLLSCCPVEP